MLIRQMVREMDRKNKSLLRRGDPGEPTRKRSNFTNRGKKCNFQKLIIDSLNML